MENTIDESRTICWAAKWFGKPKVEFAAEWKQGEEYVIDRMWELLDEADVVVGFNSNKFDIKKVNTSFIENGMAPPSPYKKIDLLLQARKHFGWSANRLKNILTRLGLTPKLEDNANMKLWMDVYWGEKEAQKRMQEYNIQDTLSTEELYEHMLGWIQPHPNWGLWMDDMHGSPICPNCGSDHIHKRGFETTKVRKYQRYQCQSCGAYHRGRKSLGNNAVDNGVLA